MALRRDSTPSHDASRAPGRIVAVYACVAALWILFSDSALALLVPDPVLFAKISIFKGWGFVAVTSALLYVLIKGQFQALLRSQAAVEEGRKRFQALFEQAGDGIFFADSASGRYLDANPAGLAMLGYDLAELRAATLADCLAPHEHGRLAGLIDRLGSGQSERGEWTLRRKDGATLVAEIAGRLLDGGLLLGIARDVTRRKQAQEDLARSVREKEVMLHEIHHRVKNNLQVIVSLLSLQAGDLDDARGRAAFLETTARVRSMALIHEKLYRSGELAEVDMREYCRSLMSSLMSAARPPSVEITHDLDVRLAGMSIEQAVPSGLMLNELVTNALKHAFAGRHAGRIAIALFREGAEAVLAVEDDGAGFDHEAVWTASSLGYTLIRAWCEQLHGRLAASPGKDGKGSRVVVRFPMKVADPSHAPQQPLTGEPMVRTCLAWLVSLAIAACLAAPATAAPKPDTTKPTTAAKSAPKAAATSKASAAPEFEAPPQFQASRFLDAKSLSGPSFRVESAVTNDGYLNTYLIRSRYGDFTAVSTALAKIRIREIAAMDAIAKLDPASEMGKGFVGGIENTVEGAKNLLTAPAHTIGQAMSGVGKMFARVGEGATGTPSKYEDDKFKSFIGLSKTKREYATQLGIDPYSTNPELQRRLEKIASAGYTGGLGSVGLKAAIPGGVGLAVSATSTTKWLEDIDLTLPPTDLRRADRAKLQAMGVTKEVADNFVDNAEFTPSQQAYMVAAMDSMRGVGGLELFIRFAMGTNTQDLALYRLRLAQMYAGYHHKKGKIERFVALGRFVAGRTTSGKLVICQPLDYLVWTQINAHLVSVLADEAASLGAKDVELWLTGQCSDAAAKNIARHGFKVVQSAERELLE